MYLCKGDYRFCCLFINSVNKSFSPFPPVALSYESNKFAMPVARWTTKIHGEHTKWLKRVINKSVENYSHGKVSTSAEGKYIKRSDRETFTTRHMWMRCTLQNYVVSLNFRAFPGGSDIRRQGGDVFITPTLYMSRPWRLRRWKGRQERVTTTKFGETCRDN